MNDPRGHILCGCRYQFVNHRAECLYTHTYIYIHTKITPQYLWLRTLFYLLRSPPPFSLVQPASSAAYSLDVTRRFHFAYLLVSVRNLDVPHFSAYTPTVSFYPQKSTFLFRLFHTAVISGLFQWCCRIYTRRTDTVYMHIN